MKRDREPFAELIYGILIVEDFWGGDDCAADRHRIDR